LGAQWLIASFRRRSFGSEVVDGGDNTPILWVCDGEFIEEVIAVVLETTGDIGVVHGEGPFKAELCDNVSQFRSEPLARDDR
jgi:hypothetical protein